jgi:hypothetical protein
MVAAAILLVLLASSMTFGVDAFAPSVVKSHIGASSSRTNPMPHQRLDTRQFINLGERERDALTRDSEPENFFAT